MRKVNISKLVIQRIPVEKLKPADYNPRKDLKPEDQEYQKIKQSIIEYGCVLPLVIIKEIRKGDDKISKNSVNDDAAKKKKRNRIKKRSKRLRRVAMLR